MAASVLWVEESAKYLGQQEIPGPGFNPWLKDLWHGLPGGKWFWDNLGKDDSKIPWCGAYMAFIMKACGIAFPTKYSSALAWANWGVKLTAPTVGCIVVYKRDGGGHVGIVIGKDQRGRLIVRGGNQRDGVRDLPFDRAAEAYLWPPGQPIPLVFSLPLITSNEAASRNEA